MNTLTMIILGFFGAIILIAVFGLFEMNKNMTSFRHSLEVTLEKDRDRAEEKIMRNEQTFLIGTDKDGKLSIINATPDGDPENPDDMKILVKETKKNRKNRRKNKNGQATSSNTNNVTTFPNLENVETIRIVTEVYRYTSNDTIEIETESAESESIENEDSQITLLNN
jgi:hypothetical protein